MNEHKTEIAVRIITINKGKVLLISNDRDNFYYFIGGKIQFGETIESCAKREINEETGLEVELKTEKLLYIQELIIKQKEKHKIEFFILASINKSDELEGIMDPAHNGTDHLTWKDITQLPQKLIPK